MRQTSRRWCRTALSRRPLVIDGFDMRAHTQGGGGGGGGGKKDRSARFRDFRLMRDPGALRARGKRKGRERGRRVRSGLARTQIRVMSLLFEGKERGGRKAQYPLGDRTKLVSSLSNRSFSSGEGGVKKGSMFLASIIALKQSPPAAALKGRGRKRGKRIQLTTTETLISDV